MALEQRPPLSTYEQIIFDIYLQLSSSRRIVAEGAGGIPFTEILAYLDFCEMDRNTLELAVHQIILLDRIYISDARERARKDQERRFSAK